MKPKLVEVEWVDARSVFEQMSLRDALTKVNLADRITCGYLIDKSRERVLVAGTYDPKDEHDEEGAADFTVIPRGWVKAIRELQPRQDGDNTKEPVE